MSPQQALLVELSHELNTPLAVIRNALYLAGLRVSDPDVRNYLHLAEEAVDSASVILRHARAKGR